MIYSRKQKFIYEAETVNLNFRLWNEYTSREAILFLFFLSFLPPFCLVLKTERKNASLEHILFQSVLKGVFFRKAERQENRL